MLFATIAKLNIIIIVTLLALHGSALTIFPAIHKNASSVYSNVRLGNRPSEASLTIYYIISGPFFLTTRTRVLWSTYPTHIH